MKPAQDVREVIGQACSVTPRGVMTDIDGTISRIASHPHAATVEPAARRALSDLSSRMDLVAAVSGRSAEDARLMVDVEHMVYSGNHGMEIWRDGSLQKSGLAAEHAPRVDELMRRLQQQISIPGVYFENKELTASVHVRETDDPETAEQAILRAASRIADELELRITRGRMVIEIRPPVDLTKGTAVLDLAGEYGLRGLVYFGDDMTDIDAFNALRRRRLEGGMHFYSVGVAREQTPAEVREAADALVDGVDGVVGALEFAAELIKQP